MHGYCWFSNFIYNFSKSKIIIFNYYYFKFNYTRISWSKGYKCNYRDIDEINVILISVSVGLITVCFYIAVRLLSKKETKLFEEKKKTSIFKF